MISIHCEEYSGLGAMISGGAAHRDEDRHAITPMEKMDLISIEISDRLGLQQLNVIFIFPWGFKTYFSYFTSSELSDQCF
jgi:hypothetical protein